MTLSEFALLVGAEPKWVLNAAAVVPAAGRYTEAAAERLALAKALQAGPGIPLPRAFALAGAALATYRGGHSPVTVGLDATGSVGITVDVRRLRAAMNARLALLRTTYAPRQRGRRAGRRNPVAAAAEFGLDLSLLRANLRRTPEQLLRQLDGMAAFARGVRRVNRARKK